MPKFSKIEAFGWFRTPFGMLLSTIYALLLPLPLVWIVKSLHSLLNRGLRHILSRYNSFQNEATLLSHLFVFQNQLMVLCSFNNFVQAVPSDVCNFVSQLEFQASKEFSASSLLLIQQTRRNPIQMQEFSSILSH